MVSRGGEGWVRGWVGGDRVKGTVQMGEGDQKVQTLCCEQVTMGIQSVYMTIALISIAVMPVKRMNLKTSCPKEKLVTMYSHRDWLDLL